MKKYLFILCLMLIFIFVKISSNKNTTNSNTSFRYFNSNFKNYMVYNDYDQFYYVSINTDEAINQIERSTYYDLPYIEKFCKLNLDTGEFIKLLDYQVYNLVFSNQYVYFYDYTTNSIRKIKEDQIEEVIKLDVIKLEEDFGHKNNFFVDNNYLYLMTQFNKILVYDLKNMSKPLNIIDNINTYNNHIQIINGTILTLTDNLNYINTDTTNEQLIPTIDVKNLIVNFYKKNNLTYDLDFDSFLYDKYLAVSTNTKLFLINVSTKAVKLISEYAPGELRSYYIFDDKLYYVLKDELYEYNIINTKNKMIVSFLEDKSSVNDYEGFENINQVFFENNTCFFYVDGLITYSYKTIAKFDLNTKKLTYLADYFPPKINKMTSLFGPPFTFDYPNDYTVFIDYGSSGGTILSNYNKKIRFFINPAPFSRVIDFDKDNLYSDITNSGDKLYYYYADNMLNAHIIRDEIYININVVGNVEQNEGEILEIIKSINIL